MREREAYVDFLAACYGARRRELCGILAAHCDASRTVRERPGEIWHTNGAEAYLGAGDGAHYSLNVGRFRFGGVDAEIAPHRD
jgi:hypothetical protein